MGGEFHHNALGLTRSVVLSTNGASWESPGCNPGYALVRWVCLSHLAPLGPGCPIPFFPLGLQGKLPPKARVIPQVGSLDVFFPGGQKPNPPFWVTLTGNSVDDKQITGGPLVSGVFLTFGPAGDILFTDTPSVFVRDFGNIGPPALVHRFSKVWFLEAFGLKMPDQDTSSRATKVRLLS